MAFSLQNAYDSAADGAVITVPAGVLAKDHPNGQGPAVYGDKGSGAKRVTFVVSGSVVNDGKWLTIQASNVTLRGSPDRAFWAHSIAVGEGGDSEDGPKGVVIENLHADGYDNAGSEAICRNVQFGPLLIGFGPGQGVKSLDPNSSDPRFGVVERFYAARGGSTDIPDPFVHSNSAGAKPRQTYEDCIFTGWQTMDADAYHTGGGIIWGQGGEPVDWHVLRRCTFEWLAIQGLQTTEGDGISMYDCVLRAVYEPFSNVGKYNWVLADGAQKELIVHKSGGTFRNGRFTGNKFCNGTRPQDFATCSDVRFENNDLGRGNDTQGWTSRGAIMANNTFAGSGCSGATPPPPPTDTPPVFVGNFVVKSYTRTRVVIGWTKATDDKGIKEYRLYRDGAFLSSAGPLASQAKFAVNPTTASHVIAVEAVDTIGQKTRRETAIAFVNNAWVKNR